MAKTDDALNKYTLEELRELWLKFRDRDDAVQILADLMGRYKPTARKLIKKFETEMKK